MDFLQKAIQQFQNFYSRLKTGAKYVLIAFVILVIACLMLLVATNDYSKNAILYSGLDASAINRVQTELDRFNIGYRVKDNAVYLKNKDLHRARLELAEQEVSQVGVVGYEIFDKSQFGTSDYVQKLNYQRALEGELARTIQSISGIRLARVHLVLPKKSLFSDENEEASASIVLAFVDGFRLSGKSARAIINLVASSVQGLDPGRVTLIDSTGQMLARGNDGEATAGLNDSQLEIQQATEKYLEDKALSMLSQVLGLNKAVIRVNALIDFDRVDRFEQQYDPNGQVVKREEKQLSAQGGVMNKSVDFEVSHAVEHVIRAPGSIKKLTVAAVIDGVYDAVTSASGETTSAYRPRSAEQMNSFKKLISQAVGLNEERGDTLEIVSVPFREEALPDLNMTRQDSLESWFALDTDTLKRIFAFLLLVGGFFLIIRWSSLTKTNNVVTSSAPEKKKNLSDIEKEVKEMAKKDPGKVARLISTWVSESKRPKK